jgi:hypothetical protein
MCIDYTSLNKACIKDEYSLPHICQIVDSMVTFVISGRVFRLSSNQPHHR